MKTALVMGISGGFGAATARALAGAGWSIRALARDPKRIPRELSGIEVVRGDASDIDAVRAAARGAEVIVYGVNPPRYAWKGRALPMLEVLARVAEEQGATVVFPGNVYVFDPADGPAFNEHSPMRPVTAKGAIRKAMEDRLRLAAGRGARVIVLRMGDYIGEHTPSGWLGVLVKRSRRGFTLSTTGPRELPHTWAYLADAARVATELAEIGQELPPWNVFHFRGHRASFNDLASALRRSSGKPVRIKRFPWWALRMMAPFSVLFRGLLEMRYLWNKEVHLDDAALRRVLGNRIPHTPIEEALREVG